MLSIKRCREEGSAGLTPPLGRINSSLKDIGFRLWGAAWAVPQ